MRCRKVAASLHDAPATPLAARWRESYAGICFLLSALAAGLFAPFAFSQTIPAERPRARPPSALTGWADWENGEALLKRFEVPPAPILAPADEGKSFRLAPGYRIELVAAEPLVQNPIFFEFDPDGRIWVVEYQGYMRDLEGRGEGDPICRVIVLEDTDGDGRADKSTVFLDKLVMPRSFAFVKGGILLQEPPHLWFCADTDGDLRCDKRIEVGTMGVAGNPQHTANGLRRGLDNWLHCADWPKKFQWRDDKLVERETIHRGQFGVTFDEAGRFMTCYENSALHADLIPSEYLLRNRNLAKVYARAGADHAQFGVNVNIARDAQEVFPIRVTPAVTLGALELRDDGRLRTYTIVSGSCFYDGDQFPTDARGNVFVPEAGGHLIGRLKLSGGIEPRATRFYPAEQEFLASTDERFRPVNARVGPDGALYIADMYHGIIEHVIFMVPWLTKQIRERHLGEGNDLGRIWRVVAENRPLERRAPRPSKATSAELVKLLGSPNGWHRNTAQRLLVERRDQASVPLLKSAIGNRQSAIQRLHALWTLDGLDALDWETKLAAMDDPDERVRAAALRLAEKNADDPFAVPAASAEKSVRVTSSAALLGLLARAAKDPSEAVRLQATLTLGALRHADTLPLLAQLVHDNENALFRTAALTGLEGRELEFLELLLNSSNSIEAATPSASRGALTLLAQCIMEEGDASRIAQLLDKVSAAPAESRIALLGGIANQRPPKPISLAAEPAGLTKLARADDAKLRRLADRALVHFSWPGATALSALAQDAAPLTPAQQNLVETGQAHFTQYCAPCHQPHGGGNPGVAPPLVDSDWVAGPPERLVRIVWHGLYGPIEVSGQPWNLAMPAFGESGVLDDEKFAAILSYVRRAWGNTAPPVEPSLVASVRKEIAGRTFPWRAEELMQVNAAALTNETPPIKPNAVGELPLPARAAVTYGQKLAYRPALDVLAPWRVQEDWAEWRVDLPAAGDYEVFVTLAADAASAGDHFVIETEGNATHGTVLSSGNYETFREVPAGKLRLRAGVNRILMRPDGPLRQELADVRALRLTPVR